MTKIFANHAKRALPLLLLFISPSIHAYMMAPEFHPSVRFDPGFTTPIGRVIESGNREEAMKYFKSGEDLNKTDVDYYGETHDGHYEDCTSLTPLMSVILFCEDPEFKEYLIGKLIEYGADPDKKTQDTYDYFRRSPLTVAINAEDQNSAELLIENGATVDSDAIRTAIKKNAGFSFMKKLTDQCVRVDTTTVCEAIEAGMERQSVDYLVSLTDGVDEFVIGSAAYHIRDAKHFAKLYGEFEKHLATKEHESDHNSPRTPADILAKALDGNNLPVIDYLLNVRNVRPERNALLEMRVSGCFGFYMCRTNLTPDLVRALVERGADVNVRDNLRQNGKTLIMYAIESENPEMVKTLVDLGCDLDAIDENGHDIDFYLSNCGNRKIADYVRKNRKSGNRTFFHRDKETDDGLFTLLEIYP